MAVLVSIEVKNKTQEGYANVLAAVCEPVKKFTGLIMHYTRNYLALLHPLNNHRLKSIEI